MISPDVRVFSPIPVNFQSWRIQYSDLTEIERIGLGSSSEVFRGYYKKMGKQVAIKKLNYKQLNGNRSQTFQREVSILASISHPSIVKFVGATDKYPFCIVTEWMPNGNLFDDLHSTHILDATMRTIALFDIARGMQYLHSKNIVHRDLKSLNILLDEQLHARICDFGYSKDTTTEDLMTLNIGTPCWMAPEIITTNSKSDTNSPTPYTRKVDVYSYGIIFWEAVTGEIPYQGMEPIQIAIQVVSKNMRPPISLSTPAAVRELMERCWDTNPEMRPTFDDIVRMFKSGRLLLKGADKEKFMEYVKETIGSDPLDIIEDLIRKHKIKELIDTLLKQKLPTDTPLIVRKCWYEIEKLLPKPIIDELNEINGQFSQSTFSSGSTFASATNSPNNYEVHQSFFQFNENQPTVSITVIGDDQNSMNIPNAQLITDIPTAEITVLSSNDYMIEPHQPKSSEFKYSQSQKVDQNESEPNQDLSSSQFSEEDKQNIMLVCMAAPLFLETQLKSRVASLLRILPPGSVPESVMASIAEMIPSGSDEFDDDIVIASCKNGAADVVTVYAISLTHLKLALEVVAREGVDIALKAAVADRCIQVLTSQCRHIPYKHQNIANSEDANSDNELNTTVESLNSEQSCQLDDDPANKDQLENEPIIEEQLDDENKSQQDEMDQQIKDERESLDSEQNQLKSENVLQTLNDSEHIELNSDNSANQINQPDSDHITHENESNHIVNESNQNQQSPVSAIEDEIRNENDSNPNLKQKELMQEQTTNENAIISKSIDLKDELVDSYYYHELTDFDQPIESNPEIKHNYRNEIGEKFMGDLTCAAIRCVVGIGEVKRLSPELIKKYLICSIPEIRNCIYSALAALAMLGAHEILTNDFADIMLTNIKEDEDPTFAENALVAITKISPNIGKLVLSRFLGEERVITDISKYSILLQRMILVLWQEPDYHSFIECIFAQYKHVQFIFELKSLFPHE